MAETRRRGRMAAWLVAALALSLLSMVSTHSTAQSAADETRRVPAVLALLYAPPDTPLASILDGTARVGFTPLITPGAPLHLERETTAWVRLRADLPERAEGEWVLRIEPAPIRGARLYSRQQPDAALVETGFFDPLSRRERRGTGMRLPLPAGPAGATEWYLEIDGDARTSLLPVFMDSATADAVDARTSTWLYASIALLLLVAALGALRAFLDPKSGAAQVAFASVLLIPAALAWTGLLYTLPIGEGFARFGTMGLWMLLLLPCGPLLLATTGYSGAGHTQPALLPRIRLAGLLLPGLAVLMLLLRSDLAPWLQLLVWLVWVALAGLSLFLLLADSRTYRWVPILLWLLLLAAFAVRAAVDLQWLAPSAPALFAALPLLALLCTSLLLLPWIRALLQQRQAAQRRIVRQPSRDELLAEARKALTSSLGTRIEHAAQGDVQWIVFNRLLSGLKPLLRQQSLAVVAMNYQQSDLLLVQPPEAEARYRSLLELRSSMLRGLSLSRGAQQLAMDFDGPKGPLPVSQLAAIPLPIERPGWGLLLLERPANAMFSDAELELCSEFAVIATQASDDAAAELRAVREEEFDADTGVFRAGLIQRALQEQIAESHLRGRPVTIMRVDVDGYAAWREQADAPARDGLRRIGEVLREELEFGEALGRLDAASFLMVLHGKNAHVCRPLANRLAGTVANLGLPPEIRLSIGISELRRGESQGGPMLERARDAAAAARRSGSPTAG